MKHIDDKVWYAVILIVWGWIAVINVATLIELARRFL